MTRGTQEDISRVLESNGGEASCLDSSGGVLRQRVVSADSRDQPSQGRIWQQLWPL